jgi:hypothetical protein
MKKDEVVNSCSKMVPDETREFEFDPEKIKSVDLITITRFIIDELAKHSPYKFSIQVQSGKIVVKCDHTKDTLLFELKAS